MFPLVVDLVDRRVVVIGAGQVGVDKASEMLRAGARVTIITETVRATIPAGVDEVIVRPYAYGDLIGALVVIAATGSGPVNDAIVAEANERNQLLNVVDDLARSNFFFTAVHRDGDVIVSVSTGGASPALAQWIRDAVARALPRGLAGVARQLRSERHVIHAEGQSTENRPWMARVQELIAAVPATDLRGDADGPATVLAGTEPATQVEHQPRTG